MVKFTITGLPHGKNRTFLPQFLDLFLQYGLDINKKFGAVEEPTLLTITQRGSWKEDQETIIQVMEYLLPKGLDLNLTNIYDTNFVSAAAISCRSQLLEWLINQGAIFIPIVVSITRRYYIKRFLPTL